jgi:hypothetical protein
VIGFDRDPTRSPSAVTVPDPLTRSRAHSQMDRVLAERGLLPVDGIASTSAFLDAARPG